MIPALTFALGLLALAHAPGAGPVIRSGIDARIEALFADVGTGGTVGCEVAGLEVPYDVVRPVIVCKDRRRATLELRHPVGDPDSVARTLSFEFFVIEHEGIDRQEAEDLARRVAGAVAPRDRGGFWSLPSGEDSRWGTGAGPVSIVASLVGFCLLGLGIAIWLLVVRPFRGRRGRIACAEMALLALGGFVVRWLLVPAGPSNIDSRLVDPRLMPCDVPPLGPGHGGWMMGWFGIFGFDDETAFLAGATAGALTVVPVYILGWIGAGRRECGLAGASLLALWPVHARLSPTDDASILAALLVTTALALACLAERARPALGLVLAWLAGGLATVTRPECVCVLPVLAFLVLVKPETRKVQLGPLVLASAIVVIGASVAELWALVSGGLHTVAPGEPFSTRAVLGLAGMRGGSILGPPHSSVVLGLAFLVALVPSVRATRMRVLAWLAVGVALAFPTAAMAGPGEVTARYQLALVAMAAVVVGTGSVWLGRRAAAAWPRAGRPVLWVLVALPICAAAWGVLHPPPRPTFRLEYAFFREHIESIPAGCRIVEVSWRNDLGLYTPTHLTGLLGLDHEWVPVASLDPEVSGCLVYWRPSSCRTLSGESLPGGRGLLPECALVEEAYDLEPMFEASLPARTGFSETYAEDPVTVGFYRLSSDPSR